MKIGIVGGVVFWAIILFLIYGCDVTECQESEMYVGGYQTTEYPDGSVITVPILYCP